MPDITIMRYLISLSQVMKLCITVPTGATSHMSVSAPVLIVFYLASVFRWPPPS